MSSALVGLAIMFAGRWGVQGQLAVILAWPVTIFGGWLVGDFLVLRPMARRRDEITRLSRQLRCYGDIASRDSFSRLLIRTNDELGKLSRDIHDALTRAHRDRLENVRIRRDMSDRVSRETTKATVQLTKLTVTDSLTGLANRRAFDEALDEMFRHARAASEDLACVSIDLDKFKALNDTHGHAAGDQVLQAFSEILAGVTRHSDFAARLGGDEFVLLLPRCGRLDAEHLGQRIAQLFAQHPHLHEFGDEQPTISLGVTTLLADQPQDAQELLSKSDAAMYECKRGQPAAH